MQRASCAAIALVLAGCGEDNGPAPAADGSPALDAASPDAAAGDAGTDAATAAPPLGTITEIGSCDPGALAGTTCTRLAVACPGTSDLGVSVRVTAPGGAVGATVVLGTGGAGTAHFEDSSAGALALTTELVSAGFAVVRRAWDEPGWFAGTGGVRVSSCRYATLLRWVDERYRRTPAPLCAVGLSGGAIEIGYALARWDAADRLGGAILLGGPSMTQLDVVCPSVAPAEWLDRRCAELAATQGLSCGGMLYCTLQGAADVVDSAWSPAHPCTVSADARADLAALASDGVLAPGARLAYPATRVRFVLGALECSATVLLYYDAITTDRALELPPGTPHDVLSTDAGLTATRAAIRAACAPF